MDNNTKKLECIENLINIEKNKKNDNQTIKIIIGSFSSDLTSDELNYLNEKYINDERKSNPYENHFNDNQNVNINYSNKRRRIE